MRCFESSIRDMMQKRGITEKDAAEAGGEFVGGYYVNDDARHKAMMRSKAKRLIATPPPSVEDPNIFELVENFSGAMARWLRAGFSTVTEEQYRYRMDICGNCEHWDSQARMRLGICKAPGCGCTRFKQWLSSERCALGKWPAI